MLGQENLGQENGPPSGAVIADKFQILKPLGISKTWLSYQASDRESGKLFTLKFLKNELQTDDNSARLAIEVKSASALLHPNLSVPQFKQDRRYGSFLVREFISGRSLAQIIKEKSALNQIEFMDILKQATTGLAYAHKKTVRHGNIKPSNILITDDYLVCLVDFCTEKTTDIPDDIYALGWVMYESLGGPPPLASGSTTQIPEPGEEEAPLPFLSLIPARKVDSQLETVIFRCLEKEKEKRYQSLDALRADLKRIEEGDEIRPLSGSATSSNKQIAVTATVALVLAAAVAFYFFAGPGANKKTESSSSSTFNQGQKLSAEEARADKFYMAEKYSQAAEIYSKLEAEISERYGTESREHVRMLHKLGRADLWNLVSGQSRSTYSLLGELISRHPDLAPRQYNIVTDISGTAHKMFDKGEYNAAFHAFELACRMATTYYPKDVTALSHNMPWVGKSATLAGDFDNARTAFAETLKKIGSNPASPDLGFTLNEYGHMLTIRAKSEAGDSRKKTLNKAGWLLNQAKEVNRARNDKIALAETEKFLQDLDRSQKQP